MIPTGPMLEGEGFWQQGPTQPPGDDPLAGTAAVVLPAWVENQPRRLLTALATGLPVICTPACGLGPRPGVITVPEGDSAALRAAILSCLSQSPSCPPLSTHG